VIAFRPDLVVIAYGLNDMRAGMKVEEFRAEMAGIIARLQAALAPLLVIANVYHLSSFQFYPPFHHGSKTKTLAYNRTLAELAKEKGCVYADVWSAEGGKDYLVHQDTVHANKVGNMLIAHKVFEAIIQAAPGIVGRVVKRNAATAWTTQCRQAMRERVEPSGRIRK
jgi:lysophospholipase L1-like esterase